MDWKKKGTSTLVALIFLFNFIAVLSVSAHAAQEIDSPQVISAENSSSPYTQLKDQHGNVEHCGMASCTVTLSEFHSTPAVFSLKKIIFQTALSDLESIDQAPPKRPPSA